MTRTIYLRATDEATVLAALAAVGLEGPDDVAAWGMGHGADRIDLIRVGAIMAPTGVVVADPDTGEDVVVMAPVEGWHANLYVADSHPHMAEIEAGLAAVTITPEAPQHRRAGMVT